MTQSSKQSQNQYHKKSVINSCNVKERKRLKS